MRTLTRYMIYLLSLTTPVFLGSVASHAYEKLDCEIGKESKVCHMFTQKVINNVVYLRIKVGNDIYIVNGLNPAEIKQGNKSIWKGPAKVTSLPESIELIKFGNGMTINLCHND